MQVPVSEAKGQLTDLVRRAEAGDEVILTRHGQAVVQLTPVHLPVSSEAKRDLIKRLRANATIKAKAGAQAARSQDFLYDDDGLPE